MRALHSRLERAKRLRSDDSGVTMTELLITFMLTILILAMIGSFFVSVTKITSASNEIRNSNDAASNIVNEVTSAVRFSTDLVKSDGSTDFAVLNGSNRDTLEIYALVDTAPTADPLNIKPSKIKFELLTDGQGKLYVKETKCPGTASGAIWVFTSPCTARTLGTGLLATDDVKNQLFTYRDSGGTAMTLSGLTPLSTTQRDAVASITVSVRVRVTGTVQTTANPVLITNTVVLRNLGLDTAS